MAVISLGYWLNVFRFHLLHGDDWLNAGMPGHPAGQMDFVEWWKAYFYDYTQVNGRMADSVVRLFLIPGHWFWKVLGPVVFTGISALLYCWATTEPRARAARAGHRLEVTPWAAGLLAGVCALLFPLLLRQYPIIGGEALFWMSSTVTYVVPALAVLGVGLVCARFVRGEEIGRLAAVNVGLMIAFAHLMQEESSIAMAGVMFGTWVIGWEFRGRKVLWAWTAVSTAGLLIQTFAPGIWSRFTLSTGHEAQDRGSRELLRGLGNATQQLGLSNEPMYLAAGVVAFLSAALVLLGLEGGTRTRLQSWLIGSAGVGSLVGAVVLSQVTWVRLTKGRHHFEVRDMTSGRNIYYALGSVAAVTVLLVALIMLAWMLRSIWGPAPFLALGALCGSLVAPFAVGVNTPRSYVMPYVFLAAMVMAMGGRLLLTPAVGLGRLAPARKLSQEGEAPTAVVRSRRRTVVPVLAAWVIIALMCLYAPVRSYATVRRVPRDMAANAATWAPAERGIAKARAGQCTEIGVPKKFPREAYLYGNGFWEKQYAGYMKLYYDLPEKARFVWKSEGNCAR